MDVVATHARRRRLGPGRRAAPRHLARAARGGPEPARRAQAPRLPDARRARQGAQEGRPEEGPQAAAVLASARAATPRRGPQALRDRRRPRRRRRVPHGRAGPGARRAPRPRASPADAPAGPGHPRHARVRRDARGGARRGRRRGRRRRAARRRAADARRAAARSRRYGFDLGVVISASHNPYRDNGIKFFGADGFKLSDAAEAEIEARLEREPRRRRARSGACAQLHGALEDYLRELHDALRRPRPDRRRRRCSTAPTARPTAPRPRSSGAWAPRSTSIADEPDGRNINDGCGSTHLDALAARVAAGGARRSASRSTATATACWPSTATGEVVDGDELIALAALHLRDAGRSRRRRGRDGDDELRLPHRDARGGHRGRHHARRRPLRARGAARARLGARRRAVGPHHRHGLRALGRRDRRRAADARGARTAATSPTASAMEKLPQRLVNVRVADRDARDGRAGVARGRRARGRGARGPRPRPRAPERHRAARPRDGRGADRARRPTRCATASSPRSRPAR